MARTNCAIGKDYMPASFKGVSFYCTDANIEGGRRGAEGEFPFGEHTAYADLGRKIRVYSLTAKFREDDHVSDSQALYAACESPGPGVLVHPTRGTVLVACRTVKLHDAIEESAGETSADLEFVEANPVGGGLMGSLFGIISTLLLSTSSASFQRDYRPKQVAQPWRADVVDTAQELITAVNKVSVHTLGVTSSAQDWRDHLKVQDVARDDVLASDAHNVDRALASGFKAISVRVQDADFEYKAFRTLANIATQPKTLPDGVARESEEAVLSRHRILAAVGMAEAAMTRQYDYLTDGLTAMDQTLTVFDDEARLAYNKCDNPLFLEIRKYAIEFAKMMNDLSYRLPGLVRVNFSGGVHPLVAAYAIYSDAKRHRELEEHNVVDANGRFPPLVVGITPHATR